MATHEELYKSFVLDSWGSVEKFYSKKIPKRQGWIYRGHRDAQWGLDTTLERAMKRFQTPFSKAPEIEQGLVRQFDRQRHLYPKEIGISDPNFMEKLALIQHHGGPTRLLDWSYSFYVSVYFALEAAVSDTRCAVWALDRDWWRKRARCLLPDDVKRLLKKDKNAKKEKTVQAILDHHPPIKTVQPLNAFRLSERHVYQQGVFLVPGDITVSFMDNLRGIAEPSGRDHLMKIEIKCSRKLLKKAMKRFHRMNINRMTLFPGLDGFVKHLEQRIVIQRARAVD